MKLKLILSLLFTSFISAIYAAADAGLDKSICSGTSVVIGGSSTGPSGASFLWDNASTLSSATSPNPIATPVVTTVYTVTVTESSGITSTDQVVITVNPLPDANAGSDQSICNGSNIFIGGSPTSSTVGATFFWDNAGTLSDNSFANPVASPTVNTTYTVTVTSPNGCTNTSSVFVSINPNPTADAGSDISICNGSSIFLGGSPTGPAGASFAWDNGSTLNSNSNANPIASPTTTTNYTVTVTDINGCTSVDQILINVNSIVNTVSQSGYTLTANQAGATYQWIGCGPSGTGPISGEANQSFSPSVSGDYAVIVTLGACSDTSNCISVVGVGINDAEISNEVKVYPNPTNGEFTIIAGSNFINNSDLILRDIQGKEVYSSRINNTKVELELDLSSGVYFLELVNSDYREMKKLIIK